MVKHETALEPQLSSPNWIGAYFFLLSYRLFRNRLLLLRFNDANIGVQILSK